MVFQDGEFCRKASDKPMLFDGWGYVPIDSNLNAAEPTASSSLESGGNDKQAVPERLQIHEVLL